MINKKQHNFLNLDMESKGKQLSKISLTVLLIGSTLFGLSFTEKGFASSVQPGSMSDPLVSQSYVDSKFNQLQNQILSFTSSLDFPQGNSLSIPINAPTVDISQEMREEIIEEIIEEIRWEIKAEIMDEVNDLISSYQDFSQDSSQGQSLTTFQPLFLRTGDILVGEEGTEIILRSGGAVGFVSGENGLTNITNGSDVLNNVVIPLNNLLIVPRSDGRGVRASTDSWFIVKGDYTILH